MANELYKSLVIDKLTQHVCFIRYKSGTAIFEKPFKLGPAAPSVPDMFSSPSLSLVDLVTNQPVTLYFNDVLMFHIKHEESQTEEAKAVQKELDEYKQIFSQFNFLRGRRLQELFFLHKDTETRRVRVRNLKILDRLQLDDLDDYDKFLTNDDEVVKRLRTYWKSLIEEKYNETMKSIDDELTNAEEDIKGELESIKEILSPILSETEKELATKKTCDEVMQYWPTLLLPRSEIFDIT